MLRISHVVPTMDAGGAELMLTRLVIGMAAERYCSSLLVLRRSGGYCCDLLSPRVAIDLVDVGATWLAPLGFWRLRYLCDRQDPDIIQGWMYHGNIAAWVSGGRRHERPRICWNVRHSLHDLGSEKLISRIMIRLGARMSSRADAVIYNSEVSAKQHEAIGYDARRTHIIPNGYDVERFTPSAELRRQSRERLNLDEEVLVIGNIGRYHPVKDHANFIAAAAGIGRDHLDARFVLAGRGVDYGNAELKRLIIEAGLTERCRLAGYWSDPWTLYPALDVLCISSRSEAFPNVAAESMACGVPCVITDVGSGAEVVGTTGIVVPPRDSEALAQGLRTIIKMGKERRRALGKEARGRIQERYDIRRVISLYEDMYEKLLSAAR